jgi:soluble P-type ATPase
MMNLTIPGFGELALSHAVFDYNGTLAVEGYLIEGLKQRLNILSECLHIHVVTGDSYGHAKNELKDINCKLTILSAENQGIAKRNYLRELNPIQAVAIGNGRNDIMMLKEAALAIAVIGKEGLASQCLLEADLIMPDIFSVFDTLHQARRLTATLRS